MYIFYNEEKYHCKFISGKSIIYTELPNNFPNEINGEIKLYSDDGFLLRTDFTNNYLQKIFKDGSLTLTNDIESTQSNSIEKALSKKLSEISNACNSAIITGVDVNINDQSIHFNLSLEDQANISNLFRVVELGGTEFPYQADGGVCSVYTAAQIATIYTTAQSHITYHLTYHNALKQYVQSLEDISTVQAIQYGMVLPEPYLTEMTEKLSVAQSQMDAIMAKLQ